MKLTEIYVVRHGESIANLERRAAGFTDTPLSELGIRQANVTAEALKDVHFDAIYSSDLSRAYNTALPHAKIRGMDVEKRENLREMFHGEWEYMRHEDINERYGKDAVSGGWHANFGTYIIPGSEGAVKVGERIYNEIENICKDREGQRILIVCHGVATRAFCLRVMGVAPEKYAETLPYPSNASYTRLSYDGEQFKLLDFSVDEHLKEVGITKVT